ncbi:hypothetical protein COX69_04065 [Candidatus Falkowbacteria bacterium CG_4_10_14_0_2_um_filter_48_10]|nr:MAG: hypothetical protein COX69_04065 [Candidatus Falkowbacteria bacterium CG_4_10_14_0_2_um_filter_48_10]
MKSFLRKKIFQLIIIFSLLAIPALTAYFYFTRGARMAAATWWNESWTYRQAITVTNNGSAQSNVYVALTLDTETASTSMQSDCGDFRFTARNGEVLAHYLMSGCRTAANVIQVNFNSFPIGAQTIYFYYGNMSAPDGFSPAGFSLEASDYTIGNVQSAETGPGPVGYWPFDEGYGEIAHDETAHKNDGTINGATWQDESMCVSGKCLWFDGVSKYVQISDSNSLHVENFALSFWVKPVSWTTDSNPRLLSKRNSESTMDWDLYYNQGNYLRMNVGENASGAVFNALSISLQTWHNIVAVKNNNDYFLYENGVLIESVTFGGSWMDSDDIFIGSYENGTDRWFHGFIDEVKIYPYARTADQIKQDYNAGRAGIKSSQGVSAAFGSRSASWLTDGLVGYWQMDESATTSGALDASGNGNDGTYYGYASTTGGKFGNNGVFDGSEDGGSINILSNNSNSNIGPMSISLWVKADSFGYVGQGYLISKADFSDHGWALQYVTTNSIISFWSSFSGDNLVVNYNSQAELNKWLNFILVWDGTNQAEMVNLYKNGTLLQPTSITNGRGVKGDDSNEKLTIGNLYNDGLYNRAWDGQIDEVRIYNRALSPDEVRRLYEWAPGPVAHWRFDEKSGTTAFDSAASTTWSGGNHGSFGAGTAAPTWAKGKYGGSLEFDGNNDYVSIRPQNYPSITVSGWFYREISDNVNADAIFGGWRWNSDTQLQEGYDLRFYQGNPNLLDWILVTKDSSGFKTQQSAVFDLKSTQFNKWHSAVGVYDSFTGVQSLFVNGILRSTVQHTPGNTIVPFFQYTDMRIGYSRVNSGYFNGLIDDVRIYNYARTQRQITEDMLAGNSPLGAPLLHLRFDEGYGALAQDESRFNKDFTLSGASHRTLNGLEGSAFQGGDNRRAADDADDAELDFAAATDFTLSAWIKYGPANPAATEYIIHKQDGNEGYSLSLNSAGALAFGIGDTSSASFPEDSALSSGRDYADGQWHHVLGVKTSNTKIELYVDGVLAGSDTSLAADGTLANAGIFYIGDANATDGTDEFQGLIDDVRVYGFAANLDDIKQLANRGQAVVFGSTGSVPAGSATSSQAASLVYCVPGSGDYCAPPVAEWKFDEKAGTTTNDTSGNGNDGQFVSQDSSPQWTRGKFGNALQFDGVDDKILVAANDPINNLEQMTISAWVKAESYGEGSLEFIVSKEYNSNSGWYSRIALSYSNLNFIMDYDGANDLLAASAQNSFTSDNFNSWHNISIVWDGSNLASGVTFYRDGQALGHMTSVESDGVGSRVSDATSALNIGNNYFQGRTFDGSIDQVRIYNYVRTPAQVAWEYNQGKPIAHWRFDECQGGTIHDESGNGRHGQLYLGASDVIATGTCASSSASFWYNGRTGKYHSAGSFDGADDYVNIGDTNLNINTVAFWLKPESTTENIIDLDGGTHYIIITDGIISAPGFVNPVIYIDGLSTNRLDTNWRHILIKTATAFEASNLTIGKRGTNFFDGLIDDVKIWNYALTDEQVKTEYNGGAVRFE